MPNRVLAVTSSFAGNQAVGMLTMQDALIVTGLEDPYSLMTNTGGSTDWVLGWRTADALAVN